MVGSISWAVIWNAPNHPNQRYRLIDLGKDPATVSKWCTNASQPSLEVMMRIATLLTFIQLNLDLFQLEFSFILKDAFPTSLIAKAANNAGY